MNEVIKEKDEEKSNKTIITSQHPKK